MRNVNTSRENRDLPRTAPDPLVARTRLLVSAFHATLGAFRIGPGFYQPEIAMAGTADGGPVLHLRLVSPEPGRSALLVGKVLTRSGVVELRAFPYLDSVNQLRFRRPLDLDPVRYDALLEAFERFFAAMDLRTSVRSQPESATPTPARGFRATLRRLFVAGPAPDVTT